MFFDSFLKYPRAYAALLVALSLAAGLLLIKGGVRFDYSLENFLPKSDPSMQVFRDFVAAYEPDDAFVAVGFEADDVFSFPVLRDLDAITRGLDTLANVTGVVTLTSFEELIATSDGIGSQRLIREVVNRPDVLAAQRRRVLADSLAVHYLVNPEGTATALFIELDTDQNDYAGRKKVIDGVKAVLKPYDDRYTFHYSGIPFLRNNYVDLLQIELVKYVLLSSLIIALTLFYLFRSVRGVVLPLTIVYLSLLWTIGAMMALGSAIDVLTSTLATILVVVGVADAIHLLTKYYNGLAEGLDKRAAILNMLRRLGTATLLTSITTAVGFGTLVTSKVVPMQRFGLFTAMGVLFAFFISLILITCVLLWTKPPATSHVDRLGAGRMQRWLLAIDRTAKQQAGRWVMLALALLGLGIWGMTQLRVNASVNDDLGPRTQVYQDMRWFEETVVSPIRHEVLLTTNQPGAFKDPDALRRVDQLVAFLEAQPEITRTVALPDFIKRVNRALHADSTAYYRLPDSEEAIAQELFLIELSDDETLYRFADYDFAEVRLSSMIKDVGSEQIKQFEAAVDSAAASLFAPDVTVTQTGTVILAAELSDYLVESLLYSIGLAFVFISILMGVLFRNVKLLLISLIPNILPLVLTGGLMGWLGVALKPATAVVFSISFGIAVDDTIHFLARLREESRAGHGLDDAVRRTLLGTGKAIILTSLILFGGFFVLVTSSFQSTMYMGVMVAVTIGSALFADLLLLPALLHLFRPRLPQPKPDAPISVPAR